MQAESADQRLQKRIEADRARIANGERPLYHALWTAVSEGADVGIRELPLIHLFVPDPVDTLDGARGLIAAKLAVDAGLFDVVTVERRTS